MASLTTLPIRPLILLAFLFYTTLVAASPYQVKKEGITKAIDGRCTKDAIAACLARSGLDHASCLAIVCAVVAEPPSDLRRRGSHVAATTTTSSSPTTSTAAAAADDDDDDDDTIADAEAKVESVKQDSKSSSDGDCTEDALLYCTETEGIDPNLCFEELCL
ncbi:hypothetical protein BX600DRAFT_89491 [Xylariales sp. PMI_506]|nr:hypothetical protein BX600DRAFT_89491 [Xylariales sp. PMI_506]